MWNRTGGRIIYASIGYNCGMANARREHDVREPADFIIFTDTWGGGTDPRINPIHCGAASNRIDGGSRSCTGVCPRLEEGWPVSDARHNGGINCAHFDGHAKWEKIEKLYFQSDADMDATKARHWHFW
jgi:prepilin-type processing-associated H-X9-DG protein